MLIWNEEPIQLSLKQGTTLREVVARSSYWNKAKKTAEESKPYQTSYEIKKNYEICESRQCHTTCFLLWTFCLIFSMLILPLPLLRLGSKSTSLNPGFHVHRPRQYDTICWELNLISGFFAFWLIVWEDDISTCGWCLARGRVCYL